MDNLNLKFSAVYNEKECTYGSAKHDEHMRAVAIEMRSLAIHGTRFQITSDDRQGFLSLQGSQGIIRAIRFAGPVAAVGN